MCPDYDSWAKYLKSPKLIHDKWIFVHLNAFPIASRVADYNGDGYAPIGYFQMWHPSASRTTLYPQEHGQADRTDMIFAKGWPRGLRELIPEVVAIHLDSDNATMSQMGRNWKGRKTSPFSYAPPKADRKWARVVAWVTLGLAAGAAGTMLAVNWEYVRAVVGL